MQILGKRSKVLLIVIAIVMLVALGVSFALWDNMSTVNAISGDLSQYANAKVGDVITFGNYYQSKEKLTQKDPIEWLVVDKNERTGQLTLMSKFILACGSFFGNYYDDGTGMGYNFYYNNNSASEIGGISYNQAYVDSTARAYLNNLERLDMGGDMFDAINGYIPSGIDSTIDGYDVSNNNKFVKGTGLLSSVGFSNKRYWTNFNTSTAPDLDGKSGFYKRADIIGSSYEFYYQRPIESEEYTNRPATKGFYDEAFSDDEKSMIVPKAIAGYTGHRWPDSEYNIATKSYVEGAVDKVWLPSVTELNIMNGIDWNGRKDDDWTNPSDEAGSTVFDYFKNYSNYTNPITNTKNASVIDAIKTVRTELATDGKAGNYSIPVYDKGTTTPKTAINSESNSMDHYWTRSLSSYWSNRVRTVESIGKFSNSITHFSRLGVRPCVILQY